MPTSFRLSLAGASGRMGRLLVAKIQAADDMQLVAATVRTGSKLAGTPALQHLSYTADCDALGRADVIVDYSSPHATCAHLEVAVRAGVPILIGTTGLGSPERAAIAEAAKRVAVLEAPNTALGVVLLAALVETAAAGLPQFDIEIIEAHHNQKRDAPSGTALFLGHAAARGRGAPLEDLHVPPYDGDTGPRRPGSIGFAAVRAGDIVGEHTVLLAGPGQRLEITHRATDRGIFADGALTAARWLVGKPAGHYGMRDVLGV